MRSLPLVNAFDTLVEYLVAFLVLYNLLHITPTAKVIPTESFEAELESSFLLEISEAVIDVRKVCPLTHCIQTAFPVVDDSTVSELGVHKQNVCKAKPYEGLGKSRLLIVFSSVEVGI